MKREPTKEGHSPTSSPDEASPLPRTAIAALLLEAHAALLEDDMFTHLADDVADVLLELLSSQPPKPLETAVKQPLGHLRLV